MIDFVTVLIIFIILNIPLFSSATLPWKEENDRNFYISNRVSIEERFSYDLEPKNLVLGTTNSTSGNNWWEYPSNIKETKRSGNDLLVLVNKEYKLPSTYAPSDLVTIGNSVIRRGNSYQLRSIVIDNLKELVNSAKDDGVDLSVVSAYRSYNTQVSTYNRWVRHYNNCVSCADKISARPGHSEHQLGTTIDFSSNEVNDRLGSVFNNTGASKWLEENAYKYGFVLSYPKSYEHITGYSYESWHYRYIGKDNALEMKNSGMIRETYLRSKN